MKTNRILETHRIVSGESKKVVIVYCPLCNNGQLCETRESADRLWDAWKKKACLVASRLLRKYFNE